MSTESNTKKLLDYRETMEARLAELEQEIIDIKRAIAVIDKMIVAEGFKTPTVPTKKVATASVPLEETDDELTPGEGETSSITSKDGVVLGKLKLEGRDLAFKPQPEHEFTVDVPPFKSFLVDRVLENMRTTDQERAANGEISIEDALSYEVKEDGGRILEIIVTNYGGERRLREISSSLRWSFDKMHDKQRQG